FMSVVEKGRGTSWIGRAEDKMAMAISNLQELDEEREHLPDNVLIALDSLKEDLSHLQAALSYERELDKELIVSDMPELDVIDQVIKDRPEARHVFEHVEEADRLKAS